jgi:hypothetical protein
MSLNQDIEKALHLLLDEGKLLHWRDFKYPNRQSGQQNVSFHLLIEDSESGEDVSDEELDNFFTDAQIEFIFNFRKAANATKKDIEDIYEYAESLSEIDLDLNDLQNENLIVEFSIVSESLGWLADEEIPFSNPRYPLMSAIASNPSLDLNLAKKICDSYVKDSMEDSDDGWVAIGLIANPNFASLHPKVIETFAHTLVNYWTELKQIILISDHIQNRDLDKAFTFREIYSYDMGRVIEGFDELFHYEWDMMKDSDEADNPEFIPLYHASANAGSGIALLDDSSDRLVYFGEIEESYKSSFKAHAYWSLAADYPDLVNKIVKPVLDKSNIHISRYSAEEINDLFGGSAQDVWDFLCTELDQSMLVSLIQFGDQELVKAIIANESLPKELKVLATLHSAT